MIRVLIVEDQAILRESLARSVGDQPDMTVVSAIADASEALGVALKERPDMILFAVMRSTLAGYCTFPKPSESIFSGAAALDDVELSILRLACEGKSRREIAAELFMSEGTIKRRISEILNKTGYDNIMRLAVRAVTEGSIVPNMER